MLLRKRSRRTVVNEINVVPLIDIMLVLLVIFMVTAPIILSGVEVNLPKASSKDLGLESEPLVVSLDIKGNLYIMQTKVEIKDLAKKLKAITKEKYDTKIFIKGDTDLNYGTIIKAITLIGQAGFHQVGLVSKSD
ncbi:hypothetical protein phytr_840 [Candidatus Phycorickettsia trachydisci]|uniref:Protein TolR n=1 Tax=Candidatus Phycorickettsia trachydisci TaxID=2115978 RepID=A0A2P1P718_9RICK|nr:biopolymer transporter ExbD [Candidatus Phycorickettsia trachydisci]AVP87046.1 hypothetical protein phytr_840 [Candidatus Phycorickettsia trachydisci]